MKLAKNSKFWHGIEKQLPTYLKAEGIQIGYYLVIVYWPNEYTKIKTLSNSFNEIAKMHDFDLTLAIIDATLDKSSASKIK